MKHVVFSSQYILWIFFQNKNYVVQSANNELNKSNHTYPKRLRLASEDWFNPHASEDRSEDIREDRNEDIGDDGSEDIGEHKSEGIDEYRSKERSQKNLRLASKYTSNPNASGNTYEYFSCLSPSVENVLNSYEFPNVTDVPEDAPSTSSHTKHLRTNSLGEVLNESQGNPSAPFVDEAIAKTQVDILDELDQLDEEIQNTLLSPIMSDMMIFQNTKSPPINNEEIFNPKTSDIFSNLGELTKNVELALLDEIMLSFQPWDSSALKNNVTDALNVLPEAANDSNIGAEISSSYNVECSTENISSISNIHGNQLAGVGHHSVYVDHIASTNVTSTNITSTNITSTIVTSTNITSTNITSTIVTSTNVTSTNLTSTNVTSTNVTPINVSEKEVIKNPNARTNDIDTRAATSSPDFSLCEIALNRPCTDITFIKKIMSKLISNLKIHRYISEKKLNASIEQVEILRNSSPFRSSFQIDLKCINAGNNAIIQLLKSILICEEQLNLFDRSNPMSEFLNSPCIINACCACLLVGYDVELNKRYYSFQEQFSKKRNTVSRVLEKFLAMDDSVTIVRLNNLLNYARFDKDYEIECIAKWVFCLVQEKNSFNHMSKKLNEYYRRLESVYSFSEDVVKILEDNEKNVDEKAQDLKILLESYVEKLNSFMRALEMEHTFLIKELSYTLGDVKKLATFLFYHVGRILLMLLSWNLKKKTNFLFIITVLNHLIIECGKHINCESDLTKEISALLTEKESSLQALFANVFLLTYSALISQLKVNVDSILDKINEQTKIYGKLDANEVLQDISLFKEKVHQLKDTKFSILVNINDKKKQYEQHAPAFSKLRDIDHKVKILVKEVKDRNKHNRINNLKECAPLFGEIIREFNCVFQLMGLEQLDVEKLEQLKIHEQNAEHYWTIKSCFPKTLK